MVLFVNGLAVATVEIKNPWTGQTTYHARIQYEKHNPHETLLNFARCVVHFAVDTDDVHDHQTGEQGYLLSTLQQRL